MPAETNVLKIVRSLGQPRHSQNIFWQQSSPISTEKANKVEGRNLARIVGDSFRNRLLVEGDATKHFSVKKRVFSEKGGDNSVN